MLYFTKGHGIRQEQRKMDIAQRTYQILAKSLRIAYWIPQVKVTNSTWLCYNNLPDDSTLTKLPLWQFKLGLNLSIASGEGAVFDERFHQ